MSSPPRPWRYFAVDIISALPPPDNELADAALGYAASGWGERGGDNEGMGGSRFSANAANHLSDNRSGARRFRHRRGPLCGPPRSSPLRKCRDGLAQILLAKQPGLAKSTCAKPVLSNPTTQSGFGAACQLASLTHRQQFRGSGKQHSLLLRVSADCTISDRKPCGGATASRATSDGYAEPEESITGGCTPVRAVRRW